MMGSGCQKAESPDFDHSQCNISMTQNHIRAIAMCHAPRLIQFTNDRHKLGYTTMKLLCDESLLINEAVSTQ